MSEATLLFARHGYDPTSVSDIVDAVGVGKGVFYWYFDGKEALLREILTDGVRRLRRHQRDAIATETDPLRRIEIGVRASVEWQAAHRDLVGLVRFAAGERRFADTLRRAQDVVVADIVAQVKDAIVAGQVRDEDPHVLAHALLGVTAQLTMLLAEEHAPDPDELADTAVRFCLAGLAA